MMDGDIKLFAVSDSGESSGGGSGWWIRWRTFDC